MDAIGLIERDHRHLEGLFTAFERAARDEDRRQQRSVVREIVRELSIHAAIEEEYLYPALAEAGVDGVNEAIEEHHVAKVALSEIEALPVGSERFDAKVRVLAEDVRRHVEEEERELLPQLRQALDAQQLRQLGRTLETARKIAPTRPHPGAPATPPANFVVGTVTAVWDRSRDAIRDGFDVLYAIGQRGADRSFRVARNAVAGVRRSERQAEGDGWRRIDDAAGRGREAVSQATRKGRDLAGRLQQAGSEAADRIEHRGEQAARTLKERTRAATRGYSGEAHRPARRPARPRRSTARAKA